ncbi:MAG: selenocysteine-specific translation elongation factor, partial [Candidatus Marinimicrobia bacterium]|nr:selenocysteine-specific translation elongation factor [Candidatus Neomarinimicrobiota bacterium]
MTHLVIGTAGHIDHGKSSLVKALTGTDPDRFAEEKQRGLTIDIGFAFLGDSITFIDVPGHEKFIKNMVSGVAGIDAVMLVIAADDGIMLQTKEHLDILNLLHIKQGFVALTKIDLVEKDWLELVNLEIEEFLQGTFLENAPIFNVSSTKSDGIDKLSDYLKTLSANQKKDSGVLRMPIDRSFSIEGFGTVVTGTVMSGNLKSQDSVEILPLGKRVKVRGIQSHGKMISSAKIGDRVALNLQNISKDEPGRGQVICQCGFFEATDRFYAEIKLLKHIEKSIKNNERLRIHLGTTEYLGRITTEKNQPIQPGESRLCYIRLESKGMVFHGQPMVIRRYSPPRTIAGGVVLTYEKIPHSMKKNQWFQELQFLAKDDLDEKLNGVFLGKHFLTRAEIFQKLSQRNPEIQKAIDYKIKSEKLIEIQVSGGRFVAQAENLKILKNQLVKA